VNNFRKLFLGNLAPDNYELEIIAINQIETEIGNHIKLSIVAQQFFYKTAWFWLLISVLIFGISYWIVLQYLKAQRLKQQFSDKVINAHIEEQALLSQKLHDSVGQKLLLAKNNFIFNKKIPKEELTDFDEIISEIRNISHDLHPLQFESLGFKKSVKNLVKDFQRNSSIFYSYEIDCQDSIFPTEKQIMLFGIIQECLNNVEKHSEAEACQIKIIEKGSKLLIQIKDNGKGFDKTITSKKFSLGLKTMKEKSDYLGATLTFLTKKNEGTRVNLTIKFKH
jgi:signal transduction histidine kinase